MEISLSLERFPLIAVSRTVSEGPPQQNLELKKKQLDKGNTLDLLYQKLKKT